MGLGRVEITEVNLQCRDAQFAKLRGPGERSEERAPTVRAVLVVFQNALTAPPKNPRINQ
jgi:hypothetical protein